MHACEGLPVRTTGTHMIVRLLSNVLYPTRLSHLLSQVIHAEAAFVECVQPMIPEYILPDFYYINYAYARL